MFFPKLIIVAPAQVCGQGMSLMAMIKELKDVAYNLTITGYLVIKQV